MTYCKRRGLTMGEILVAIFLLSVALLGTAASLHYGTQAAMHGSYYTDASSNARMLLELMLAENRPFATASLPDSSSGYNDLAGVVRPLDDPPFNLADYRLQGAPRFRRHIEVRNYSQASDSAAMRAWKDDVRQVTVSISWTEGGRDRSLSLSSFARRPR